MRKAQLQQTLAPQHKQIQKLILSPQMQQALHLLQLPVLELSSVISEELANNPVLEYFEEEGEEEGVGEIEMLKNLDEEFREIITDDEGAPSQRKEEDRLKCFLESSLAYENSLFDHLMKQVRETFLIEEELRIAEAIIGNLDEQGLLTASLEEIALILQVDKDKLLPLLQQIQTFDPLGVAARSLQESLLIQLKALGKESTLAFRIVNQHYEEMIHNRIPAIAKALRFSATEIRETIEKEIARLDLHPGAGFDLTHYQKTIHPIIPDVAIVQEEGSFVIEVNEESIPTLRLNRNYLKLLDQENLPEETKRYIQEKIASGKWLLRNIHERHRTLYRIAEQIIETQSEFLSLSQGKLKPLTMKVVAEKLSLHESTIARAVANKYLSCARGVFPLRSFFTHAYITEKGENVSSKTVKEILTKIIREEDRATPLSDEAISSLIKKQGIPCARRTVAKYRQELGIGNTTQRKIYS